MQNIIKYNYWKRKMYYIQKLIKTKLLIDDIYEK